MVLDEWLSRLLVLVLETDSCLVSRAKSPETAKGVLDAMRPDVIVLHRDAATANGAAWVGGWKADYGSRVIDLWQRAPELDGSAARADFGADGDLEMPFEVQDLPDLVRRLAADARHSPRRASVGRTEGDGPRAKVSDRPPATF